jgi:flavin-binding protein dodecin
MQNGVKEAAKTVKNIKQIDVKWVYGHVEHGKITSY